MSSFFPSYNVANMDFNDDDLVGLVSSERSTTTKQSQSNGQSHPHNIFDISAPAYTNPPYHFSPHFNSTIPPLASYDEQNGHLAHSHTHSHLSRSRSRSRPPSIGPTRSRRGNSISSTSPPPHSRPNPSHIMIPSSRAHQASSPPPPSSALSTGGWYIPPTPDSIGNPHSLPYTHYDDASSGLPASFPNFSPVQSPTSAGGVGGSVQDKQSLLANEKRRRRRESHNAVERRRRDNINEKITELATLIPECLLEGATPNGSTTAQAASSPPAPDEIWGGLLKEDGGSPPSGSMPELVPGANNVNGGVIKANKGMILTKSVEYIRFLQQLVTAQGARNRELESELRGIRGEPPLPSYHHHSTSHSHTNHTTGFSAHGTHTMSESGSAFSGSPLGDVQEEDLDVKPDPDDDSESGGEESRRRGRRRHRGEGMDVDV